MPALAAVRFYVSEDKISTFVKYVKHALSFGDLYSMNGIWYIWNAIANVLANERACALNTIHIQILYLLEECVCNDVKLETAEAKKRKLSLLSMVRFFLFYIHNHKSLWGYTNRYQLKKNQHTKKIMRRNNNRIIIATNAKCIRAIDKERDRESVRSASTLC